MKHHRPFLVLWVVAVTATVAAFVVHLALRGRTMALGYELGKVRAEQARLREVKRVLELEVASYHTPQRVEMVARTVLHMEPPTPDRILLLAAPGSRSDATPQDAAGANANATPKGPVKLVRPDSSGSPVASAAPVATELVAPRIAPPKTAAVPSASTASAEPPP